MNIQSMHFPAFGPRFHFDEGAAGGAGAGGGGAGAGAGTGGAAGGGGSAAPWFTGIEPEIIGHWENKGWKKDDPKALATELTKAWKGLERHFGTPADQLLKLPKDAADEAGWAAVRERLGAPKEAKDYDFSGVKFADGTDLEQGFVDTMRAALHKVGAPKDTAPEVVKAVVKFMGDAEAAETTARTAKLQADRTALQQEWGSNFEFNRLTAMQGAKRAVGGNDERAAALIKSMEDAIGYKNTMEFWRKIGAGTNEDTFVEAGQGGNPTTRTGAAARVEELKSDPAWVKRYLAGDIKAKQEMDNLLMLVHGAAA